MIENTLQGEISNPDLVNSLTLKGAALFWFKFGLQVIPVIPGTKRPAVKWDPWLNGLNIDKIMNHWDRHPDHEVAHIVGSGMVVFDMDTKEADIAMLDLMRKYDVSPFMVARTNKGTHHYYGVAEGVIVKGDSHSTTDHPDRIDVKAERGAVMLPPSKGKKLLLLQADNVGGLAQVNQKFVDAIFAHNGRPLPSNRHERRALNRELRQDTDLSSLSLLLSQIDPDCGYEDWLHAIMAVYHETGGSEEGLDLVDDWSSNGEKYKGFYDVETTWMSLEDDHSNPITIATLYSLAMDNVEPFERCETVVVHPKPQTKMPKSKGTNPFKAFSLKGCQEEILKRTSDQKYCLEGVAIKGQLTVFYAPPNTGKTLIVLKLLTNAINSKQIDADNVYYLDCDDNAQGLSEKNAIAVEFGFHLVADGWNQFSLSKFYDSFWDLTKSSDAPHTILVLDTLKKFVDPMSKSDSSRFGRVLRRFVQVGGTVVVLAHTNKNRTQSGGLIPAGTSDILDDFDAAFVLDACPTTSNENEKMVTFTNIKRRGNNVNEVSYAYSSSHDVAYRELFESVSMVCDEAVSEARTQGQLEADALTIEAIKASILAGVNGKMAIIKTVNESTDISTRKVGECLERYADSDAAKQLWKTTRGEKNKFTFELIED